MKMIFDPAEKPTITKEELAELPSVSFDGRIVLIDTLEQVDVAVEELMSYTRIGIDTETRPSFSKGKINKVSLLQLSGTDTCYLFRLNKIGFPPALVDLLATDRVQKIGLSLRDDFRVLRSISAFQPRAFIELQELVRHYGMVDQSLQKIFGLLFGLKISKRQRLTNWEADVLDEKQQKYAAIDAWACLLIYEKLLTLNTPKR